MIFSILVVGSFVTLMPLYVAMVSGKDNCLVSSLSHPSNSGYFSYPVDIFSANFRNGDNIVFLLLLIIIINSVAIISTYQVSYII